VFFIYSVIYLSNCSQGFFSLNKCFDTIVHVLHKFDLVSAESSEVRDIEYTVIGLGMLTMNTSNLDVVLISNGVHEILLGHEFREVDMN